MAAIAPTQVSFLDAIMKCPVSNISYSDAEWQLPLTLVAQKAIKTVGAEYCGHTVSEKVATNAFHQPTPTCPVCKEELAAHIANPLLNEMIQDRKNFSLDRILKCEATGEKYSKENSPVTLVAGRALNGFVRNCCGHLVGRKEAVRLFEENSPQCPVCEEDLIAYIPNHLILQLALAYTHST